VPNLISQRTGLFDNFLISGPTDSVCTKTAMTEVVQVETVDPTSFDGYPDPSSPWYFRLTDIALIGESVCFRGQKWKSH
jgi:hypothetical protein